MSAGPKMNRGQRRRFEEDEKLLSIAVDFGVSDVAISNICTRRAWGHVA